MKNYYDSPVGWLELSASEKMLTDIRFLETKPDEYSEETNAITKKTIAELEEYFDGKRAQFSVPLEPKGTDFQQLVWEELQTIPYGQTINYGELAKRLGDKNKMRAVGKANGQNPIPIIIPCHRVIGVNNNLVGYRGGIACKKYLLQHEGAILL